MVEPGGSGDGVLTALDAATAQHTGATFTLISGQGGDPALALVGGARTATGSVNAAVAIDGAHVQLIAQALGPGRALVGDLSAGDVAHILRRDGGTDTLLCSGQAVPVFDSSATTAVGLAVVGHTATLSIGGAPVATCDLSSDPDATDHGAWGIAAVGGTKVTIATITVSR